MGSTTTQNSWQSAVKELRLQGAPFTSGLRQDGRNEDDPNTHRQED